MVVFYHIPKTAGTSFARAAAAATAGPSRRILLTQMTEWLRQLEAGRAGMDDVAFLVGHFGYGVHHRLPGEHRTITFLRSPIEQTISMQFEAGRRPDIYPHDDLRTMLRQGAGAPYFGNPQVRHLAGEDGRPVTGPLLGRHLARAKQVVTAEMTCFGITEYFAASLELMNDRLGLELTPNEANVSARPAVRDLDPELFVLAWNATTLDRELYDYCLSVFVERAGLLVARAEDPVARTA